MASGSRTPIFAFDNADNVTPSRGNHRSSRLPSTRDTFNRFASSRREPRTNSGTSVVSSITNDFDEQEGGANLGRNLDGGQAISSAVKKLHEASVRMEKTLSDLTAVQQQQQDERSKSCHVPHALSAIVREAYSKLVDEEERECNFLASFDDDSNKEINRMIFRNVQAVAKDYDVSLIKRATRVHFKSKKSLYRRKLAGRQEANAAMSQKHQRRHNKARARLRVLNLSKTLDDGTKEKIRPVLKAEFMSSQESVTKEVATDQERSSESDTAEVRPSRGRKKLIKHKLPWRSQEIQRVIDSLDRKLDRRRDDRAKKMCLEMSVEGESTREKPDHLPQWATELFS